jgi:hypothetical protein
MLRAVDDSESAKPKHIKLVRALFSDDELLLLFYNSLTDKGKNFVLYAERFELFDNLPVNRLVQPEHKDLLSPICFGEKA